MLGTWWIHSTGENAQAQYGLSGWSQYAITIAIAVHEDASHFISATLRALDEVAAHSAPHDSSTPDAKPPVQGSGVYVGIAGHAWVHLHLWIRLQLDAALLERVRTVIQRDPLAAASPWLGLAQARNDAEARVALRWLLVRARDVARTALSTSIDASRQGRPQRLTLLEGGIVGPLVVLAVAHEALGERNASLGALRALIQFGRLNVLTAPPDACELLYGRAGYLAALQHARAGLLFVHRVYANEPLRDAKTAQDLRELDSLANSVLVQLFDEGSNKNAVREPATVNALEYRWSDTPYLGCAHGLAGVVHVLLEEIAMAVAADSSVDDGAWHVLTPDRLRRVRQSVLHLLEHQFPSGNLAISDESPESDRLVQWCHGAPGLIFPLASLLTLSRQCNAWPVAQSTEWMQRIRKHLCVPIESPEFAAMERAMERAGEDIVRRGLSRNGVGLCHGICGNIYALLRLHRYHVEARSNEQHAVRWLQVARDFAEHVAHAFTGQTPRVSLDELLAAADRPWSLYEGAAAVPCAMLDVISPMGARQPAFETWGPRSKTQP